MLWSSHMGVAWIESCVVVFAVLRLSRGCSNILRRAWHSWLTFGACNRVKFELGFCNIIPGGGPRVVLQPHGSGSFGVVSVYIKVWALHVQWLEVLLRLFHAGCISFQQLPRVVWSWRELGLIFFKSPFWGAYFWRGLSTEGNLRFKIYWASLIVGSKFTVFALFSFVFEGNSPRTSFPGGLYYFGEAIWRRIFCVTGLGGLYLEKFIHGGAYFRNFTVNSKCVKGW